MTTIVCQDCNETIAHLNGEKVEVLYGKCSCCQSPSPTVESKQQAE